MHPLIAACLHAERAGQNNKKNGPQPISLDGRGPRQQRNVPIGRQAEINRGLARAMIKRYSLSCQRMICRGDLYGAWRNCLMHLLHCFQGRAGDHFRYAPGKDAKKKSLQDPSHCFYLFI